MLTVGSIVVTAVETCEHCIVIPSGTEGDGLDSPVAAVKSHLYRITVDFGIVEYHIPEGNGVGIVGYVIVTVRAKVGISRLFYVE